MLWGFHLIFMKEAPEPDHNPVLISGTSTSSRVLDLGNGSEVMSVPRFLSYQDSWSYFDYLNKHIPWTRPTIRVFGRSSVQVPPLIHSILLPPPIFSLQLLVLVHTPMKVPSFYPVFSLSLPFFFRCLAAFWIDVGLMQGGLKPACKSEYKLLASWEELEVEERSGGAGRN